MVETDVVGLEKRNKVQRRATRIVCALTAHSLRAHRLDIF
jgi:hypothetical protein